MKRSKLFLGLSTFALAAIGVIATKASTKFTPNAYISTGSACVAVTVASCNTTSDHLCTYRTLDNGGNFQAYASQTTNHIKCKTPLKRPF